MFPAPLTYHLPSRGPQLGCVCDAPTVEGAIATRDPCPPQATAMADGHCDKTGSHGSRDVSPIVVNGGYVDRAESGGTADGIGTGNCIPHQITSLSKSPAGKCLGVVWASSRRQRAVTQPAAPEHPVICSAPHIAHPGKSPKVADLHLGRYGPEPYQSNFVAATAVKDTRYRGL